MAALCMKGHTERVVAAVECDKLGLEKDVTVDTQAITASDLQATETLYNSVSGEEHKRICE